MDIESLRWPSAYLAQMLNENPAVGTEEMVEIRRKVDQIVRPTQYGCPYHKSFYSGSRAEGLQFKTSDHDIMLIDEVTVWDSERDRFVVQKYDTVVLMRRDGCNPGFVFLQLISRPRKTCPSIWESTVQYQNVMAVSSLLYRDHYFNGEEGYHSHGPCMTTKINGVEYDFAHCLSCPLWPTEAYPFIHRLRPYNWPDKDLLDRIILRGCHIVPIGDHGSDISHIQWRISFSAAEKALVHSFNHTQLKVYVLLKIFLKQVIDKVQCTKGLLCSYFLKTAVFYSAEQTPASLWRDDLTIVCFWFCLNKLIQWVQEGHCPNYFVPENNMFRNKIYGEHRLNLLHILNTCKRIGWSCLFACEELQSQQLYITCPITGNVREPFLNNIERIMNQVYAFMDHEEILKEIERSIKLLFVSRSRLEVDISSIRMSRLFTEWAQGCASRNLQENLNNKSRYLLLKHIEQVLLNSRYLYIGKDSLLLATIYYKTGRYSKALQICKGIISKWKRVEVFSITCGWCLACFNHQTTGRRGQSLHNILTRSTAVGMSMTNENSNILPKELHDAQHTGHRCVHLPPLPYIVFLSFLCYNKLGNIDNSLYALHDLRALACDIQQGCKCPCGKLHNFVNHMVLNMLAICLEKVGGISEAIELCLHSQDLIPEQKHSSVLLSKMLSSD